MVIASLLGMHLLLLAPPVPAISGSWVGTLEYRDFSDNSRQKIGTLLRVYQSKGESNWIFRYVYDDGPHKVIQESETVAIDLGAHTYVVTSEDGKETNPYSIGSSTLSTDGTGTLVLAGLVTENKESVDVRTTVRISANHLDFLRETRLKGQPFKFRHEYSFSLVSKDGI